MPAWRTEINRKYPQWSASKDDATANLNGPNKYVPDRDSLNTRKRTESLRSINVSDKARLDRNKTNCPWLCRMWEKNNRNHRGREQTKERRMYCTENKRRTRKSVTLRGSSGKIVRCRESKEQMKRDKKLSVIHDVSRIIYFNKSLNIMGDHFRKTNHLEGILV